jgi:hypothetical protein
MMAQRTSAEMKLDENTIVTFASVEQGKKILGARDEFVQRLSDFDRSSRMKTDENVSEDQYLEFVANNVLGWDENEKVVVSDIISNISSKLTTMNLPWPDEILLIKTTGREEGNVPYTRANAVMLPKSMLNRSRKQVLHRNLCHELFHVLSRNNPDLREKLYQSIGYFKCKEIEFPAEYTARKITNPDGPINDHCIRVKIGEDSVWAMPILYSKSEKYDTKRGGEFFNYLLWKFLVVAKNAPDDLDAYDKNNPRLVEADQVSGLYEQIGHNTQYIIHPDEILADNFVLLALGGENISSPEIIDKMKTILGEYSKLQQKQNTIH